MTLSEAMDLVTHMARAATDVRPDAWAAGSRLLEQLDGRAWLLVDQAARSYSYVTGTPVSGAKGWMGAEVTESTGFVAAVTSLHADGRIRQRATVVLEKLDGLVPATALAVRLLDHVPQVREAAQTALVANVDGHNASAVLGVLLAGRGRQYAGSALASVRTALLARVPEAELVATLLGDHNRDVRRWAFSVGHERNVLPPERLLSAVHSDPDQWVRAVCAEWLVATAEPAQLRELLVASTVEARLVALTRLSDEALTDEELLPLLEQARWRARRRNIDVGSWYRSQLDQPGRPARTLAGCLEGLASVGGPGDLDTFAEHLHHRGARVRAAAVTGVSAHAPREVAIAALKPVLLDASSRVASIAARALARGFAPPETAAVAWASPQPWSRQAAWRMSRAAGNWDRVEADLRAVTDPDQQVASLGNAGIRTWLETTAATTWAKLSDAQQGRIRDLLTTGQVDPTTSRSVAFHARIKLSGGPEDV
jgi:hypothetical protein